MKRSLHSQRCCGSISSLLLSQIFFIFKYVYLMKINENELTKKEKKFKQLIKLMIELQ